jgi:RNA polymerase Rpb1, domain 6
VGQLIQLRYGEDGLCGEMVEFQTLPTIKLSNDEFERGYRFDPANERQLRRIFTKDVVKELMGSGEVNKHTQVLLLTPVVQGMHVFLLNRTKKISRLKYSQQSF